MNLKKQSAKTALVEITIHEGRKRQVRRMFAAVGLPVEELHRRRYGPIGDKGLEPGGYRELTGDEVEALRRAGEEVQSAVGQRESRASRSCSRPASPRRRTRATPPSSPPSRALRGRGARSAGRTARAAERRPRVRCATRLQ